MTFGEVSSIVTLGPLAPEFLVSLLLSLAFAVGIAHLVWRFGQSLMDRGRRVVYGGLVALVAGFVVLIEPPVLLGRLYRLIHPNTRVDPYVIWPGLLAPTGVYLGSLIILFMRRETRRPRLEQLQ